MNFLYELKDLDHDVNDEAWGQIRRNTQDAPRSLVRINTFAEVNALVDEVYRKFSAEMLTYYEKD